MRLLDENKTTVLTQDDAGTLRVGGTRVTLDTLVHAFGQGFTTQEVADQFPVLGVEEIEATVAYYLRHRDILDAHLEEHRKQANEFRRFLEAEMSTGELRERLRARRRAQAQDAHRAGEDACAPS